MAKEKYVAFGGAVFAAFILLIVYVYMENNALYNNSINTANVSQSSGASPQGLETFPLLNLNLPEKSNGLAAIAALGERLPEVARFYGISAEELTATLKRDKDLHIDGKGRLVYFDSTSVQAQPSSISGSDVNSDGAYPLDQTFNLNSRPGVTKVIYLDFNGEIVSGKSPWGGYTGGADFYLPAFDFDGNPSSFSDAELVTIQQIWMSVAEDYLPFNVNVTTQDPGPEGIKKTTSSDNSYGTRSIITSAVGFGTFPTNWAGYAYHSTYGSSIDTPTLSFAPNMSNAPVSLGENVAHEVGHTFNLFHHGRTPPACSGDACTYYYGHNGWAPIMGVGFGAGISHWNNGSYDFANNTQDDLAILASIMGYATDDVNNEMISAQNAAISGNTVTASGIIGQSSDIDFFRFNTASGPVSLTVLVGPFRPNPDLEVKLYDSSGSVLAASNPIGYPPTDLGASIDTTVNGGTYYISVKGVGKGDNSTGYPAYGSLGQYYISGTIVGTNDNPPVVQISANPTAGNTPLNVQFSSTGSSDPDGGQLTYSWNFGDGTSGSTEANPMHTYNNLGTYTATLTVRDPSNLSASKSTTITAQNLPPVANFTSSVPSNNIPATVTFDASSSSDPDGTITSYAWDFGDGSQGSGVATSHTYTTAGTRAVRLTVTDNSGQTGQKAVSYTFVDPNALNAPTNLKASTGGRVKGQVTLTWVDNSPNETNFYIERASAVSVGSLIYQRIATVGPNIKTFSQTLTPGVYHYRVQAYNSTTGSVSVYSNAVKATIR